MAANTDFNKAVSQLNAGHAVVFPTDTVYGLGIAVEKAPTPDIIYDIKERDRRKPIAWLVGGIEDLDAYGKVVPEIAKTLARTFWPGPLTLIVRAGDAVPEAFRSPSGTIGLRMPASETARNLIERVGCPLATSSANLAGGPSPRAYDELDPALLAKVSCALRDGEMKSGISSTVVDCSTGHAVVLREGAITIADIQALC